jgi:hypothetical protein
MKNDIDFTNVKQNSNQINTRHSTTGTIINSVNDNNNVNKPTNEIKSMNDSMNSSNNKLTLENNIYLNQSINARNTSLVSNYPYENNNNNNTDNKINNKINNNNALQSINDYTDNNTKELLQLKMLYHNKLSRYKKLHNIDIILNTDTLNFNANKTNSITSNNVTTKSNTINKKVKLTKLPLNIPEQTKNTISNKMSKMYTMNKMSKNISDLTRQIVDANDHIQYNMHPVTNKNRLPSKAALWCTQQVNVYPYVYMYAYVYVL